MDGSDTPLPPPPPISWTDLGTIIPVASSSDAPPQDKPPDADDSVQEDDGYTTWHDVALAIAAELMGKIRKDVHEKLGYTTSAVS